MSDRISRSERILNRAEAQGLLSANGKAAFIVAADPYHDDTIPNWRGWPDLETYPSVCRCEKYSTTITASAAGDNILIYTWPILNQLLTNRVSRRNGLIDTMTPGVSTDYTVAPLTIQHFANTTNMTLTSGTAYANLAQDPDTVAGIGRLCGWGVEIHDVTADLYKQGTLTVFQVPQGTEQDNQFLVKAQTISTIAVAATPFQGRVMNKWPDSLSDIMLMPGTRQWDTRQGIYAVIPLGSRDNFANPCNLEVPVVPLSTNAYPLDPGTIETGPLNIGTFASGGVATDPLVFLPNKLVPYHSKGILLSGLAAQSTFTINMILYVESFPSIEDRAIVTLARPSAEQDLAALTLISKTMHDMPVGVPVGMNVVGEWFADVAAEVLPWLGAGLSVLMPELSPAIGAIAAQGTQYAKKKQAEYKAEKLAKRKPSQTAPNATGVRQLRADMGRQANGGEKPKRGQPRAAARGGKAQPASRGDRRRSKDQRKIAAAINALESL